MIEFTPIPVRFELERFGSASIDLHEWMRLRKYALEFVVGKGVNATSFTVLHTEAGFADLASHTQVRWLADHFELLCVAADEKHRHFLDIQYDGVIHRIPFEALLPDKICATLFRIGVAVDRTFGAYEAMSMYLQACCGSVTGRGCQTGPGMEGQQYTALVRCSSQPACAAGTSGDVTGGLPCRTEPSDTPYAVTAVCTLCSSGIHTACLSEDHRKAACGLFWRVTGGNFLYRKNDRLKVCSISVQLTGRRKRLYRILWNSKRFAQHAGKTSRCADRL